MARATLALILLGPACAPHLRGDRAAHGPKPVTTDDPSPATSNEPPLGETAEPTTSPEGRVVSRYEEVRGTGCTVDDFRTLEICTPLEAQVLRNVPLAMAGQPLEGPGLGVFSRADGAWYPPRTVSTLGAVDAACVAALAEYEEILRSGFSAYDATAESRILATYDGFHLLAGRESLCEAAHRRELRSYPAAGDQILEYLYCWDDGSCVGEGLRCNQTTCVYHAAG